MKRKLSEINKFRHFKRILWHFEQSDNETSYVVGDADGSFARVFISAFIAGFIDTTPDGLKTLEDLLEKESKTLIKADIEGSDAVNAFSDFQKDKVVYGEINTLLKTATYKESKQKLLFLGDILFDRLSNNISASIELIENLHRVGAIFIKGNHDHFEAIDHIWTGYGANRNKTSEDKEKIKKTIDSCFILAHYDKKPNILYTHAALGKVTDTLIKYCHLEVNESNGENLAKEINEIQSHMDYESLQDFRPGSNDYEPAKFEKFIPKNFLHIHGHQDSMDQRIIDVDKTLLRRNLQGSICMNSRDKGKFIAAITSIS